MQIIQMQIKKYGYRALAAQLRAASYSLETTYCMLFSRQEPVERTIARKREDIVKVEYKNEKLGFDR